MTMTVDRFINVYNGRTVDVDGAYGGQCWDLWSRYAQDVAGVPQSATNTTSGYADSVYTQTWGNQSKLQAAFDKLGPDAFTEIPSHGFVHATGFAYGGGPLRRLRR